MRRGPPKGFSCSEAGVCDLIHGSADDGRVKRLLRAHLEGGARVLCCPFELGWRVGGGLVTALNAVAILYSGCNIDFQTHNCWGLTPCPTKPPCRYNVHCTDRFPVTDIRRPEAGFGSTQ